MLEANEFFLASNMLWMLDFSQNNKNPRKIQPHHIRPSSILQLFVLLNSELPLTSNKHYVFSDDSAVIGVFTPSIYLHNEIPFQLFFIEGLLPFFHPI